jgi:hypothetical protein
VFRSVPSKSCYLQNMQRMREDVESYHAASIRTSSFGLFSMLLKYIGIPSLMNTSKRGFALHRTARSWQSPS